MQLPWQRTTRGLNSPRDLSQLGSWYDLNDVSSLRNDAGTIPTTGQSIKLVSDKSGNSAVNGLVLNGVAGNYASTPDSAAVSVTGDIDLRCQVALNDWTPSGNNSLIGKYNGGGAGNTSYVLSLKPSGVLSLYWASDGVTGITKDSTVATGFSDFTNKWVRATLDVDNGSTQNEVRFYTSDDGTTWTQLGATVTTAGVTSIFNSTLSLEIGSVVGGTINLAAGVIYRAQIRNNILDNGTGIQFDADFTAQPKLATSFTESSSNAATVTINTSGATGARISGARDLYQGTSGSQMLYIAKNNGNCYTPPGTSFDTTGVTEDMLYSDGSTANRRVEWTPAPPALWPVCRSRYRLSFRCRRAIRAPRHGYSGRHPTGRLPIR
jgi:hypothetical protein